MITIRDYVRHRTRESDFISEARENGATDVLFHDLEYMHKRRRWKSFAEFEAWKSTMQTFSYPPEDATRGRP